MTPDSLAGTFDTAADIYEQARGSYPAALLDDLVELAGLRPGARLLEVGCATGKATRPLLERGFHSTNPGRIGPVGALIA